MFGVGFTEMILLSLLLVVYVFVLLAALCLTPAIQAKRRGYSFFVWLLAGILVFNPLFILVVLASVPHRRRQVLREQFRRELDAKLAAAGAPAVLPAGRSVAERSLGDLPTQLPGASAVTDEPPVREHSLGDLPTVSPEARSLGDEPTRL